MNPIAEHIKALITADGPLSVAAFFKIAVSSRSDSYYNSRVPFGEDGDFITAPEISQAFGECIGGWCVDLWEKAGEPSRFNLIELGPGRGTLMSDVLRVGRLRPAFLSAARVTLIEVSPILREQQATLLSGVAVGGVTWLSDLCEVQADAPTVLLANEFFDALPAHQYVMTERGWRERVVCIGASGEFQFGIRGDVDCSGLVPPQVQNAAIGSVFERSFEGEGAAGEIGRMLRKTRGAALIIDYGHWQSGVGNTLQALKGHRYASVLNDAGDADLTFHVDFAALRRSFEASGLRVGDGLAQAEFLRRLGILERTAALKRKATEAQVLQLDRALNRLTGPSEMGSLFKVMCACFPASISPAGF